MTEEELKLRERAVKREFPETKAAFERVKSAMVNRLLATKLADIDERERLYASVQILEAVEKTLLDAMGRGSEAIEEYIKSLGPKVVRMRSAKGEIT